MLARAYLCRKTVHDPRFDVTDELIVLVMVPTPEASARYRRFVAEWFDERSDALPFPVRFLEPPGSPKAWVQYLADLVREFGRVVIIGPDEAAGRRLPREWVAKVSYRSFEDDLEELRVLLQQEPPERGSPSSPLSVTKHRSPPSDRNSTPAKGGGFSIPRHDEASWSESPLDEAGPLDVSTPGSLGEASGDDAPPEDLLSDEVHVGASVPQRVRPGRTFTARFAAYTDAHRDHVETALQAESPSSKTMLDLDQCQWRPGARITVRLRGDDCKVEPQAQTFEWDGTWKILRFDVVLGKDYDDDVLTLRFDVLVEGQPVMRLRPEIEVGDGKASGQAPAFSRVPVPKSAFASYSVEDKLEVMARVRSLEIYTRMDIFVDRMDLVPGDEWRPIFEREIKRRDTFLLFWSRNAMGSDWVDWEWRLALREKTIDGIQPHPLESMERAPAPKELSSLQFGTMYESYLTHLREHPDPA